MSHKNNIFKRLDELNFYFDDLLDYFGYQKEYTQANVKRLWKLSGLTVDQVAEKLYRSRDRALQYCYGQNMSNKLRGALAKFFKQAIYANVYKNNLKTLKRGH